MGLTLGHHPSHAFAASRIAAGDERCARNSLRELRAVCKRRSLLGLPTGQRDESVCNRRLIRQKVRNALQLQLVLLRFHRMANFQVAAIFDILARERSKQFATGLIRVSCRRATREEQHFCGVDVQLKAATG
jgi:hypothetical protein